MALYTIADLHLPIGVNKPMDVFGPDWENYVDRLEVNWKNTIDENDTVVLPGDFSWATYLDEALADFRFLESLPGRKILLKGNHDYWWETMTKMTKFLSANEIKTVSILNNCAFEYGDTAICGTRGWNICESGGGSDRRIYEREINRLRLSLDRAAAHGAAHIYVFLHYPPVTKEQPDTGFVRIMTEYNVEKCFYGHLHGYSRLGAVQGLCGGIEYRLISADSLGFMPLKVADRHCEPVQIL